MFDFLAWLLWRTSDLRSRFQMSVIHAEIHTVCCSLDVEPVKTLVHLFVASYIDYCNSVLSSAPKKVLDKFQHVQNAAARLVTGIWKYERGLSRLMHDDLHWLVIPQWVQCLLWQSIIVFATKLHGTSPTTVCQSLKFLVASICDLPDVINCQFREFNVAPLRPVHFLSPDLQTCEIQLLTPNNLGGTWRRIYSPDIRSISTLEVFM